MTEKWITLDEFPDYRISNTGKVISFKGNVPKEIAVSSNYNNGYITIHLSDKNKKQHTFLKHRFIAKLFLSNVDNKPDINHIDGDKWNNSVDNLQWVTKSENTQHAVDTGLLKVRGENHHGSKLTVNDIRYIKKSHIPRKVTAKDLAKKFSVKPETIRAILYGYTWKHID